MKEFIEKLKESEFDLLNVTDEYKNRGSSKYVRVYADVGYKTKGKGVENGEG